MMNELPHGWTWASFSQICEINPKHPPNILSPDDLVTFVPMSAIDEVTGSIERPEVRKFREVRKGHTHFAEGDVLFAKITPCMENGKAAIARGLVSGIGCGTTELHVLRPLNGVSPDFVFHYIRQKSFRNAAQAKMTGTAGQLRVPSSYIENSMVPLAPLAEQFRIVTRIKEITEKSRAANNALERTPSLIRQFRRSILSKAFCGELTEHDPSDEPVEKLLNRILQERRSKWEGSLRVKGKDPTKLRYIETELSTTKPFDLPEGWQWATIGGLFEVTVGGTPSRKKPSYWKGTIPWVSSSEVAFRRIRSTREQITAEGVKNSSAKIRPVGTVLLAIVGEGKTRGQAAILDILATTNQNVASILCTETPIPAEYVYWWFYYRYSETRSVGEGGAQPALNVPRVKSIPIPVAPIQEQFRIIGQIRGMLRQTSQVEESIKAGLKNISGLEQSILAKAFRGELVAQDPNDESASVLLTRMR